ncbi:RDD family protein [Flavobacterium sp. P21]|uniref:RDD family protein n=1 Tax=Flavobacterium sp. P21 TaxID=3423948 RepID=UPI003D66A1C5
MSELSINTTQNVKINFISASVGERLGAYFIDLGVKIAYILVVWFVFFSWLKLGLIIDNLDSWSERAIVLLFGIPLIFYSLALESFFEGQSIGKILVKIKVVKIDGYQAGFGDYLIRWFLERSIFLFRHFMDWWH